MELSKPVASTGASPLNALTTMFYDPARAFAMLEPRRHAWLPTLLLMLTGAVLFLWYFSVVDFAWLHEQMLTGMKATEREAAERMTKQMMQTVTVASALLTGPIAFALTGVYLLVAAKVVKKNLGFGSGFALAAWSSVPSLLLMALGAIQILMTSDGQLSFSQLNPLSINQLFFQYDMGHPLATVLDSLSLVTIWNAFLMMIGFQVWANTPRSTAFKVVLLPYVAIYGGWLAYALSKAA